MTPFIFNIVLSGTMRSWACFRTGTDTDGGGFAVFNLEAKDREGTLLAVSVKTTGKAAYEAVQRLSGGELVCVGGELRLKACVTPQQAFEILARRVESTASPLPQSRHGERQQPENWVAAVSARAAQ